MDHEHWLSDEHKEPFILDGKAFNAWGAEAIPAVYRWACQVPAFMTKGKVCVHCNQPGDKRPMVKSQVLNYWVHVDCLEQWTPDTSNTVMAIIRAELF